MNTHNSVFVKEGWYGPAELKSLIEYIEVMERRAAELRADMKNAIHDTDDTAHGNKALI